MVASENNESKTEADEIESMPASLYCAYELHDVYDESEDVM